MNPSEHDDLFERVRGLPDPPLPLEVREKIRRRARAELDSRRSSVWLGARRVWSNVLVPAALLACGAYYLAAGWTTISRVYGPDVEQGYSQDVASMLETPWRAKHIMLRLDPPEVAVAMGPDRAPIDLP